LLFTSGLNSKIKSNSGYLKIKIDFA
jgi:hypothetical protein